MKKAMMIIVAAAVMVTVGANAQIVTHPNGTSGVITGNTIANSNGTSGTITGNTVTYSDGTSGVITGNIIVNSNGTHSIVTGGSLTDDDDDRDATRSAFGSDDSQSAFDSDDGGTLHRGERHPVPAAGMFVGRRGIYLDGARVSVARAKDFSREFPEAMRHFRKGQFTYGVAMAAALGGGYLVGYSLGDAMRPGSHVNAGMLVGGVALVGGVFGLTAVSIGQYRKAAAAYNTATGLACVPRRDVTLALAPTVGGLGLRLMF